MRTVKPHERQRLAPLDAFWHLLNFFAPAVGVGLIAAGFAKLLWRHELKGASWMRLALWAAAGGAGVLVAGLVVFGHDGKMATYAAMVGACALMLWLAGFGPLRR